MWAIMWAIVGAVLILGVITIVGGCIFLLITRQF